MVPEAKIAKLERQNAMLLEALQWSGRDDKSCSEMLQMLAELLPSNSPTMLQWQVWLLTKAKMTQDAIAEVLADES